MNSEAFHQASGRRVAILGIGGVIGGFFARRLSAAGAEVDGFGSKGWDRAGELLGRADLVIVSVPVERVAEIARKAASFMRADAALADVTSIKKPAWQAMMEAHSGPVVGLHPMFGPGVETFSAQTVVICDGRGREAYRWLLEFMRADGARLVESGPDEHDRMMIAVQAVRHFATMAMGSFLVSDGVDVNRSLEFASPIYRLEIDIVGRLFAQDPGLYTEIILASPERRETVARMARHFLRLAEMVEAGDREAILAEFRRVRDALGPETDRAMAESNEFMRAFSRLLSAGGGTDN